MAIYTANSVVDRHLSAPNADERAGGAPEPP
jgi:hypothetical protein